MKTKIFHTVNEGLLFETKGVSLLIDGIHDALDFKKSNLFFSKLSSDISFCFYHHLKIYKINTTHDGESFKKDCHVIYKIPF